MKKLKRVTFLTVLLSIMLLLGGCLRTEINLELDNDGKGRLKIYMTVAENEELTYEEFSLEGIRLPEDMEGISVEITDVEEEIQGHIYKGQIMDIKMDNIEEFFDDSNGEGDDLQLINLGGSRRRIEFLMDEDDFMDTSGEPFDGFLYELLKSTGGKFIITIESEYDVTVHNADSVKNGVYSWDFIKRGLEGNYDSAFLEYDIGVKAKELKNNKRIEIMNELGLSDKETDFHGKALNKLGILKGTDNGLELDKPLTRAEGAVMYSRLLGLDNEIKQFAINNPGYDAGFIDVPDWVKPTINYLYNEGLVNGIGDNKYGSNDNMTETQYATLVLRALGFNDSKGDFAWNTADKDILKLGLFNDDPIKVEDILGRDFNRRGMSYISYNALFYKHKITGQMLIDNFIH